MIRETLMLALREIRRNALRSSLTILGIVIGVAAVITMVSLGGGATQQVANQIRSLGSNLLSVRPGQQPRGPGGTRTNARLFEMNDVEAIARDIGGIASLTPVASKTMQAINAETNWSTTVTGTDNAYFTVRDWPLASGRLFTEAELRAGTMSCILGATVRDKLFGAQDPIDAEIRLGPLACRVVGLLATKGQATFGLDQDDIVVVPLAAFQRRIAGNQYVEAVLVSVRDDASTAKVQSNIEELLRERRRVAPGDDADFYVMDMQQIVSTVSGTTRTMTALLGAVAMVSLLVGGIGIMNIMLVSVTERTREIGIRLAIGATENEVLMQFLVEAVALSLLGGTVGVLLGLAAVAGGAALLKVPFVFSGGVIALAFLFSGAVGVLFGYFPARRAAQMNPIEALRHE